MSVRDIPSLPLGTQRRFLVLDPGRYCEPFGQLFAAPPLVGLSLDELMCGRYLVTWMPTLGPHELAVPVMCDLLARTLAAGGAFVVTYPSIDGITWAMLAERKA